MKTITEIKSYAWDALMERKWFGPIIISIFTMLLSLAVSFIGVFLGTGNVAIDLVLQFMLYFCIVTPFSMGARIYMLRFVRGEDTSVGDVFDGYRYAIKLIPVIIINMATSYMLVFCVNMMFSPLMILALIIYLVVTAITGFSLYLIYDNDGKTFKSLREMTAYMLKGGIIKYVALVLSYILWFIGILMSFGMLTFFVIPYMEAARAVFYDDINFKI